MVWIQTFQLFSIDIDIIVGAQKLPEKLMNTFSRDLRNIEHEQEIPTNSTKNEQFTVHFC